MESQHTIVIVGAGPTGLALGIELKRLGISSLILDRLETGANTSRAAAIHARTLEVLEASGATSELLKYGIAVDTLRIRDQNRLLASVSFKNLKTKYPFVLTCPQDRTESILSKRLQELGGSVHRPCEVVAIRPENNGVELQIRTENELKTIHTEWLIGCDGMHSLVREKAGIPFEGGDYHDNFVLADVEMDWPLKEGSLFFSKEGLFAVIPLPENRFRLIAAVEEAPSKPTLRDLEKMLSERGPKMKGIAIRQLLWSSRFRIHHRIASTLRRGRILIAGDAAHVHSPAGGQGMNIGIQDAVYLAAALKETLESGNEAPLDAWEKKRQKIARSVVKLTDKMMKIATLSSPFAKQLRNTLIFLIGKIPSARNALAKKLAQLY